MPKSPRLSSLRCCCDYECTVETGVAPKCRIYYGLRLCWSFRNYASVTEYTVIYHRFVLITITNVLYMCLSSIFFFLYSNFSNISMFYWLLAGHIKSNSKNRKFRTTTRSKNSTARIVLVINIAFCMGLKTKHHSLEAILNNFPILFEVLRFVSSIISIYLYLKSSSQRSFWEWK